MQTAHKDFETRLGYRFRRPVEVEGYDLAARSVRWHLHALGGAREVFSIDESSGGLTVDDGSGNPWALTTLYTDGIVVAHGGSSYIALSDHTADSTNEPGVGTAWETVWALGGRITIDVQLATLMRPWTDAEPYQKGWAVLEAGVAYYALVDHVAAAGTNNPTGTSGSAFWAAGGYATYDEVPANEYRYQLDIGPVGDVNAEIGMAGRLNIAAPGEALMGIEDPTADPLTIAQSGTTTLLQVAAPLPNATHLRSVRISTTPPAPGQTLVFNGTEYAPAAPAGGGDMLSAANLTDVADRQASLDNLSDAAAAGTGHVLTRDGSGNAGFAAPTGGGASLPVPDTTPIVEDPADGTKEMRIDVGAVSAATVRVLLMGDRDADLASGGTFAENAHTHGAGDINAGTLADARVATTNVTQHQAALAITESQITDLDHTPATDAVTNAILADMPAVTVKGNAFSIGASDPQDIAVAASSVLGRQAGNIVPIALMSQPEAEAGTQAELRAVSPLRLAQAIAALPPAAHTHTEAQITDLDHTPAANAVTNAILADMPTDTLKMRTAAGTGDPENVKVSALPEEAAPTTGDWILGEEAGGNLVRYNVGNLPTGGGGEANTASNAGTGGVGITLAKVGVNLPFKSINAGSAKVTVTDDVPNSNVDIDLGAVALVDLSDVAAKTGSGTTVVMQTSPTITTPAISGNLTTDGLIDTRDVATDGAKLDGIAAGANAYVHPNHTGDVTSVADGAQTIANDAVTYAKMQNVSATDRLLGRQSAGAGDVEEIPLTLAGRALLDDADASAQRTTLGLGTAATATAPAGAIVGTTDAQALTNKDLLSQTNRYRFSKSITIPDPTAADDIDAFFHDLPYTIVKVVVRVQGGTSVTWNLEHAATYTPGSGNSVFAANQTTNAGASVTVLTTFAGPTAPADSLLWPSIVSVSGAVDWISFTVFCEED